MTARRIRVDQVVREEITVATLLTWTYLRQKADVMSAKPLHLPEGEGDEDPPQGWSKDGCVLLARANRLGEIIPTTAHAQRPALHPDAEIVHDLVVELSRTDPLGAMLLVRHGQAGEAPPQGGVTPHPEPVTRLRDGREEIVEDASLPGTSHLERRRNPKAKGGGSVWVEVPHCYCPITYWPPLAEVEESRLEYRVWRRALTTIANRLPQLRRWDVRGIGAAEAQN